MNQSSNTAKILPAEAIANALKEHMTIVHRVVAGLQRRLPPSVSRDDLVAAGTIGLYQALSKGTFMHDNPKMFAAYATIRVRGAIFDELRRLDWFPRRRRGQSPAESTDSPTVPTVPPKRAMELVWIDEPEASCAPLATEGTPADEVERSSAYRALYAAVEGLPRPERAVVEMRYFQGMTGKAVASALSLSEARVSQLHARAIDLLKKTVEGEEEVLLAA